MNQNYSKIAEEVRYSWIDPNLFCVDCCLLVDGWCYLSFLLFYPYQWAAGFYCLVGAGENVCLWTLRCYLPFVFWCMYHVILCFWSACCFGGCFVAFWVCDEQIVFLVNFFLVVYHFVKNALSFYFFLCLSVLSLFCCICLCVSVMTENSLTPWNPGVKRLACKNKKMLYEIVINVC